MLRILSAATIAACLTSAASAATVTMYFEIDNVTMSAGAEEALGFAVTTISGSVSWDDEEPGGPYNLTNSGISYDYDWYYDLSYDLDFGSVQIDESSDAITYDFGYVQDGLENYTHETDDSWELFVSGLFNDIDGVSNSQAYLSVSDADLDSFSGLNPTAEELNALAASSFDAVFYFGGSLHTLSSSDITFSNTPPSAVPLPSAGWLLLAGLGALGVGRRRRH